MNGAKPLGVREVRLKEKEEEEVEEEERKKCIIIMIMIIMFVNIKRNDSKNDS